MIAELEAMLKNVDEKLSPEHTVLTVKTRKLVREFRSKEDIFIALGVKTEEDEQAFRGLEKNLDDYEKTVLLRSRIASSLERAKKLKAEGKEYAVIPADK